MLKKHSVKNSNGNAKVDRKTVAFIPVRGGSKSIPLKNIKPFAGKPLVYWVVKAASDCKLINTVYVATEDERIRQTVQSFGLPKVCVIDRNAETSTDTASTESALLDFARNYDFEHIVLIQATSPLLTAEYLNRGMQEMLNGGADSVMSVVRQKRFIWENSGNLIKPVNYMPDKRPRRQEFTGFLVENGAFYITSRKRLLETECRISGNIAGVEMPEETYFELDEPCDWIIVEQLLKNRKLEDNGLGTRINKIKMVLTDCDGVLTDGGMYYSENGDEIKKFNTRDGMATSMLQEKGIKIGIITGEKRDLIKSRAEKLHITDLLMGVADKVACLEAVKLKYGLTNEEIAYIGDDRNDLEILKEVGLACVPADGMDIVKEVAHYVTKVEGGRGVLREVAELIIRFKC
ncbi:MAG TPA: N-acylneuraminate cytidylyltransferase [Bacillota bacterium]|nr:N-acylneuraminate cytidylyltransferase [Bacillota bacterium]